MSDELTTEELLELERMWAINTGERWNYEAAVSLGCICRPSLPKLLAMARRLLDLESALTFLLHARDPDFDFAGKTGAEIELRCAKMMGWEPKR